MSLIVQKYGGTSVGTIKRIQAVAKRVLQTQKKGHSVVVVVSAMAGDTNRLVALAEKIHPFPASAAYDLLLASGEQIAVGLVTLAINNANVHECAHGFLGHQVGILTCSVFSKARIKAIDTSQLKAELKKGHIPVIAGFQGVNAENKITTLGRGGSDTSAVALAIALEAEVCEIYTDVEGVFTTDPKLSRSAKKISKLSYEEMMEFASLGAKVLQTRSVELAAKYEMPLHVRHSFKKEEGTFIVSSKSLEKNLEQVVVSGVAADKGQVKFTLQNLPNHPGVAAKIFGGLAEVSIVVDIIVQDIPKNKFLTISFTVSKSDYLLTKKTLERLKQKVFNHVNIFVEKNLSKVSIVGVGMQHHPGVAARMFKLLAKKKISIKLITTSEIKISCLIDERLTQKAVHALHQGFIQ